MDQNFWNGFEKRAGVVSSIAKGVTKLKNLPGQLAQRTQNEILRGRLAGAKDITQRNTILNEAKARNLKKMLPRQQALTKAQQQASGTQKAIQNVKAQAPAGTTPTEAKPMFGWKTKAGLGAAAIGVPSAAAYTMGAANATPQYDQAPQQQYYQ